jgi:hypothetical protein
MELSCGWPLVVGEQLYEAAHLHPVAAEDKEQYQVAWVTGRVQPADSAAEQADQQAAAAAPAAAQQQQPQPPPQQQQQLANGTGGASQASQPQPQQQLAWQPPVMQLVPDSAAAASSAAAKAPVDGDGDGADDADVAEGGGHGGIFIGNVQLSSLKEALAKSGLSSAFRLVSGVRAGGRGGITCMCRPHSWWQGGAPPASLAASTPGLTGLPGVVPGCR